MLSIVNKNIKTTQFFRWFCFNGDMNDVVVKENVLNKPMYYDQHFVLGEVPAPDSHYVPVLYSHHIATQNFNQITRDIYEARNENKAADKPKTPKGIIFMLGAGLIYGAVKLVQHLNKKKK